MELQRELFCNNKDKKPSKQTAPNKDQEGRDKETAKNDRIRRGRPPRKGRTGRRDGPQEGGTEPSEAGEGAYRLEYFLREDAPEFDPSTFKPAYRPSKCRSTSSSTSRQKSSTGAESRAFLIDHLKVRREQYEYVADLLSQDDDLHENSHVFFCHVLETANPWKDFWVPVPYHLLLHEFGLRNTEDIWRPLVEAGLIGFTEYDRFNRKARTFRVAPDIREQYHQLSPGMPDDPCSYVDLFTGRRCRRKAKSKLTDENNHPYPPLVRGALETIDTSFVHAPSVRKHLDDLEREKDRREQEWRQSGEEKGSPQHVAYRKSRSRYSNDKSCWTSILNQEPELTKHPGVYEYQPAYRVQMSGRIGQVRGGLQSCSREMKEAAYSQVPRLHNYDLKSSQVNILIQFFEEAGLNPTWLVSYKDEPEAKYVCARRTGLTVKGWKSCLYALLMGAHLPCRPISADIDVIDIIEADVGMKRLKEVYRKLHDVVKPLKLALNSWHKHLLSTYLDEHGYRAHKGRTYVKNQAGMTLCPEQVASHHKRKARMAAFLLQGKEAAYIHKLTILSQKYDYTVVANEHDGLVTIGRIPQAARKLAAKTADLKYAKLAEKDIC